MANLAAAWEGRLTRQEQRCLAVLRRERPVGQIMRLTHRQLCAKAHVARSQVKPAIDGLAALGLVERVDVPRNRFGRPPGAYRCLSVYIEAHGNRAEVAAAPLDQDLRSNLVAR